MKRPPLKNKTGQYLKPVDIGFGCYLPEDRRYGVFGGGSSVSTGR